jgi:hypothetical protein
MDLDIFHLELQTSISLIPQQNWQISDGFQWIVLSELQVLFLYVVLLYNPVTGCSLSYIVEG